MHQTAAATGISPGDPAVGGSAEGAASPLRRWMVRHDDSWLFIISYVGLAVVLSIWISVFWLVVVVGVHMMLELVRQRAYSRHASVVLVRALWELKLDLALVIFALAMGVYMEVVVGAAGLGGAARLGVQGAARAAGWTRALRGVLLSLDDVAQVGRAVVVKNGDDAGNAEYVVRRRWLVGDHIAIWLGSICLLLIVLAPTLTPHTPRTVVQTLIEELHPWPARGGGEMHER